MDLSFIAQWLNSFFAGYDYAILDFCNTLASKAGVILTPITKFITLLGEGGVLFFLLAGGLMLFPKTRKVGVCVFGSVCCGALITNILLKDAVARPRPYEADMIFRSFWDMVGSPAEDGFSFPSGHVTSAAAGMLALCFAKGKKFILPSILWIGLTMFSRNYLIAHYPSDVLFALIIGAFSAFVAWLITKLIYRILEEHDDIDFFHWILTFALPLPLPLRSLSGISHGGSKKSSSHTAAPAKHSSGKAPRKSTADSKSDWNDRWEDYVKNKQSDSRDSSSKPRTDDSDADVKVFTPGQSVKKVNANSREDVSAAFEGASSKASAQPEFRIAEEHAGTKGAHSAKSVSGSRKSSSSGEYKGRHAK